MRVVALDIIIFMVFNVKYFFVNIIMARRNQDDDEKRWEMLIKEWKFMIHLDMMMISMADREDKKQI